MISALLLAAVTAAQPIAMEPPQQHERVSRDDARWLMSEGDIAGLHVYADANRELLASADRRPRIVLMGDSLTFRWSEEALPAVTGARIVNRGIPGQISTQLLLRFEDDVVSLKPVAVVILAGTNDLRGLAGAATAQMQPAIRRIARNLTAMADIADARRVRVILCAVPPVDKGQAAEARDPSVIAAANDWLRRFAAERGYAFLDYHAALAGPDGLIRAEYTSDGLHLSRAGYLKLKPVLDSALRAALKR